MEKYCADVGNSIAALLTLTSTDSSFTVGHLQDAVRSGVEGCLEMVVMNVLSHKKEHNQLWIAL